MDWLTGSMTDWCFKGTAMARGWGLRGGGGECEAILFLYIFLLHLRGEWAVFIFFINYSLPSIDRLFFLFFILVFVLGVFGVFFLFSGRNFRRERRPGEELYSPPECDQQIVFARVCVFFH